MGKAAARMVAEPVIRSNPAAKRYPSIFGQEYLEADDSLDYLLDAATWADAALREAHLAVLTAGLLAGWRPRDCGIIALVQAVHDVNRAAGTVECLSPGPLPRFAAKPNVPEVPDAPPDPPARAGDCPMP